MGEGEEHGRVSGRVIGAMISELSINELLEEDKASLILFTELKWKEISSTSQKETQAFKVFLLFFLSV